MSYIRIYSKTEVKVFNTDQINFILEVQNFLKGGLGYTPDSRINFDIYTVDELENIGIDFER